MIDFGNQPSPFDAEGLQFAWNSTSVKLAEECLRKYYYTMIEGWQSPHLSVHLRFGQHYATALEHYHKHVAGGMERDEAVVEVVWEALRDTWDRPLDEDGNETEGEPWDGGDHLKTRGNLIRSIVWYLDHFSDDAAKTVILADASPAVELSFTISVDDGIVFAGHLDRLVEYAKHIYVQDQKTTKSTISARYFEGYSPETQMSMYTFAGKMLYNTPVNGVMIDAAQIAVGFTRFERGFTFRTEDQLNEWYDDTMVYIERARAATRERYFPMNRTACGNYGGCPFRAVCSRSPSVRENFLEGQFVRGTPMNPLSHR